MRLHIGKIIVLLAAWAASTQALGARIPDATPQEWSRLPAPQHKKAVWPKTPSGEFLKGEAGLACAVDSAGLLTGCQVIYETPGDRGFGAAALKLAPHFQRKQSPKESPPPSVRIPVEFDHPIDTPPDWLKKPTRENILAVWPTQAHKTGKGGAATISCLVNVQGVLFDCKVVSEQPAGAGFGAAGLALTPQFLMRAATLDGKPAISSVRIPLRFPDFQPPRSAANDLPTTVRMLNADRDWIEAPTYADVTAAYPEKARATRVGGHVNLNCTFDKEGRLKACSTVNEEPRGQGFAEAAKALSKQFRANPFLPDGTRLAGANVQLPVTFTTAMLDAAPPTLGKAQWAGLPSPEQVKDVYPAAATKAGVKTARAVLSCVVQAEGKLDCKLKSEDPASHGFGAAALSIAPYFRLSTWTMEGLPTIGGTVAVPIRFQSELDQTALAPAAAKP